MFWSKDWAEVKATLARIEANLSEHMRRTANLEGRADSLEAYIHEDRAVRQFLKKALGILALVATIAGAIIAYFQI